MLRGTELHSFKDLKKNIKPLLESNKEIYENYFIGNKPYLWKKFEPKTLSNNKQIEILIEKNIKLFQGNKNYTESNYYIAKKLLSHINEFEITRTSDEKLREVLFPEEINSIFGINPIELSIVSNVSALQNLITKLKSKNSFIKLELGVENPFIEYLEDSKNTFLFLNDAPRVKQMYWNEKCYQNKTSELRLESVNFLLSWLRNNNFCFVLEDEANISDIRICNKYDIRMIYKYCFSESDIREMSPPKNLIIVNLHNFNGDGCISESARNIAQDMQVKVFTTNEFYKFCHALR